MKRLHPCPLRLYTCPKSAALLEQHAAAPLSVNDGMLLERGPLPNLHCTAPKTLPVCHCKQHSGHSGVGLQRCLQQPEPVIHSVGITSRLVQLHCVPTTECTHQDTVACTQRRLLAACPLPRSAGGGGIHRGPQLLDRRPGVCRPKDGAARHHDICPCLCRLLDCVGRQAAVHLRAGNRQRLVAGLSSREVPNKGLRPAVGWGMACNRARQGGGP